MTNKATFTVPKFSTITEALFYQDGSFEQWEMLSNRSRAMGLTLSGPSLGWKPVKGRGTIYSHGITFWPVQE